MIEIQEMHQALRSSWSFMLANAHRAPLLMYLAAIFLFMFFLRGDDVAAQEQLSRDVVLSQLREALSRYDSLAFKASSKRRSSGSDGSSNGDTLVEQERAVLRHLGSRVLYSRSSKYVNPRKESPNFHQCDFVVYDDGDVLQINTRLDSSYNQIPGELGDLSLTLYSQRIAGTQKRDRDSTLRLPIEFATVTWFVGGCRLLEYLDHAEKSSITLHEKGAIVDVQSQLGNMHLSISQRYGWLPTDFEIVKKPEHRSVDRQDKTIADIYAANSIDVESLLWSGEVKEFATDKNGFWFAKDIRLTRLSRFRNRPEGRIEVETEVEELSFSPDLKEEDFHTKLVVPMGYSVTVDGATHLPYRWDGERAVPGVPELPASSKRTDLQDIARGGGDASIQKFLIALNIAVAAIVVLFVYLKRQRT
ncbi:MAG: hypothetical protein ACREHD_06615 [Pirellulales bacterium]